MRTSRRVAAMVIGVLLIVSPVAAWAAWTVAGTGDAYSQAKSMPAGQTPNLSVTGRSVSVTWAASELPPGDPVDDYKIRRFNASTGVEQTVGGNCDSFVAGLTCTENAVAPGQWKYSVAPRLGKWVGPQSPQSTPITVASPNMAFTGSTTVTSLPATLNGNLTNFIPGETVRFKLDDASTGSVLASTVNPQTIPASGSASFSVTIPKATPSGPHTVFASGDMGDGPSASFTENIAAPTPTTITTVNGGSSLTGLIGTGDSMTVTFSQKLDVASICSTWSGDNSNQLISLDNGVQAKVNNNAAASGNDLFTVDTSASVCGGQLHFGSLDMGSNGFVTGDTVFSGAGGSRSFLFWDASNFQLTVWLGAKSSGPTPVRISSSVTSTYTPNPALKNTSWIPVTGTATKTGVQF